MRIYAVMSKESKRKNIQFPQVRNLESSPHIVRQPPGQIWYMTLQACGICLYSHSAKKVPASACSTLQKRCRARGTWFDHSTYLPMYVGIPRVGELPLVASAWPDRVRRCLAAFWTP